MRLPRNPPSRICDEVLALIAEVAGTSRSTVLISSKAYKHGIIFLSTKAWMVEYKNRSSTATLKVSQQTND